ncbi:MAG: helix-turn-helix domain-containing protein [Candidatus Taylorbacteria bacterium]|nr:helix-turn-helix domain-containing protein [Candidatus Taylorbacteria bacterium]
MNPLLRQQAVELRTKKQLSYSEIKKRLGVSKSTLSYWLSEFPLTEEKILELRRKGWAKGEASRERFRATMRKKRDEEDQRVYELQKIELHGLPDKAVFIAGLMLYLAEGAKRKDSSIVLANTDARLIKFFLQWLEKYLDVARSKMRVQLHLYENMDIKKEELFWLRELGIEKMQLYKSSIRRLSPSSFSYKGSFRHGTCSLYAFGVEKRRKLMMSIRAFMDLYLK